MFIGHFALGFASKKRDHLPSLAMLFVAVQLPDLSWPIFVLAGMERFRIEEGSTILTPLEFTYYPYSHSLLMVVIWGLLLALGFFLYTRNKKAAILLVPLVISHWVLDFLTHKADLQLSPFSEIRVGLGLWNQPAAELFLESAMFITGVILYYVRIKPRRKIAFWSLVFALVAIHFLNVMSPPPPSVNMVAWSANAMWLFVLWAAWVEKDIAIVESPNLH